MYASNRDQTFGFCFNGFVKFSSVFMKYLGDFMNGYLILARIESDLVYLCSKNLHMESKRNKLFFLAGFVLFALMSCWATSASLHLLLPTWPYAFCWLISIGVFILASFGSKLIVDSLNTSIYVNKRGLKLILGLIMVILFWLMFSFPTNTHTLFYHNVAPEKINEDISVTYGYLGQLARGTMIDEKIKDEQNAFNSELDVRKANLLHEIQNPNNPGFGRESLKALTELNKVLGSDIKPLSGNVETYIQIKNACDVMEQQIEGLRKTKLKEIESRIRTSDFPFIKKSATDQMNRLNLIKKDIANGTLDVTEAEDLKQISEAVNDSYTVIRSYNNLVTFKSKEDKEKYSKDNVASETTRMTSVVDVWSDYIDGNYSGRGFIWWILLSLLVDIAAFAFFDLTFSNNNDD